eukprot:549439-Alexandrium_andersonii.AAC.1
MRACSRSTPQGVPEEACRGPLAQSASPRLQTWLFGWSDTDIPSVGVCVCVCVCVRVGAFS